MVSFKYLNVLIKLFNVIFFLIFHYKVNNTLNKISDCTINHVAKHNSDLDLKILSLKVLIPQI